MFIAASPCHQAGRGPGGEIGVKQRGFSACHPPGSTRWGSGDEGGAAQGAKRGVGTADLGRGWVSVALAPRVPLPCLSFPMAQRGPSRLLQPGRALGTTLALIKSPAGA